MGTVTLRSSDLAVVVDSFPKIAIFMGLMLVFGLILALLLTAVFSPDEDAEIESVGVVEPGYGESVAGFEEATDSRPEPGLIPVAAGYRAEATRAADPLVGAGFSPTDVVALRALRQHVLDGDVSEGSTRDERLAFARWLIERGRLSG